MMEEAGREGRREGGGRERGAQSFQAAIYNGKA